MRALLVIIAGILTLGCLNQSSCSRDFGRIDTTRTAVGSVVSKIKISRPYSNKKIQAKARTFYKENDYKIHWLQKRKPHARYDAFLEHLKSSEAFALNPADYHLAQLETEISSIYDSGDPSPSNVASLDIKITATFFLFTTHLLEGRVSKPGRARYIWIKSVAPDNDVELLLENESASQLRLALERLHPKDPQYVALSRELDKFETLSNIDLPKIKWKGNINPGDSNDYIPVIRRKLLLLNGQKEVPVSADSLFYDDDLSRAVAAFQEQHGLTADGVINAITARYLNVPFDRMAETIALNLERLRWPPHIHSSDDHILINIPEYKLKVFHRNKKMLEMKVILGTDSTATPVFRDTLKHIVLSPTWTVPKSIIEKDFLPVLQEDPAHYKRQGFSFYKDGVEIDPEEEEWTSEEIDVRSYQVIQEPGNVNALGNIKFMMSNNFSIYLHDTPSDRLFKRDRRALSHGCVRLEQPVELADYLLQDQKDWDKESIQSAMTSGQPTTVKLTKPIPVHIVYRTAWIDEDNRINFREDVYGFDRHHLSQLKEFNGLSMTR